jgi:DNA-binding transcriptional MerR regulator
VSQILSVGEAAEALGVSADTLRYYEKAGLSPGIERTRGGARRYPEDALSLLRMIIRLRLTGMPIRDLKQYVRLVMEGPHTTEDRRRILTDHRKNVVAQIDALQTNLEVIDLKLELYAEGWVPGQEHACASRLHDLLCQKPGNQE